MPVGVITDSSCDLPAPTLLKLGVAAVPLRIVIGDEVYRDWRDVEPGTLYRWMLEQGVVPQVQAPDVSTFVTVYRRYLSAYDQIVSIHHAGTLADTLQHAVEAAHALGATERIVHLDSQGTSVVLAEMVIAAARQAAAGADAPRVIEVAERVRETGYTLVTPASLEWLELADGIGKAHAALSKLLGLRPIYSLVGGDLVPEGSARQAQVDTALIRRLEARFNGKPLHLALAVAGRDYLRIDQFKEALAQSPLKLRKGRVQLLGPQLGAYLGPGTLAVCAYPAGMAAVSEDG